MPRESPKSDSTSGTPSSFNGNEQLGEAFDILTVRVLNLGISEIEPTNYMIQITFFDQVLLSNVIRAVNIRTTNPEPSVLIGNMYYDPSDYAKMSIFADKPLVVQIVQLHDRDDRANLDDDDDDDDDVDVDDEKGGSEESTPYKNMYCCNIDILPIFLGDEANKTMCVQKRMRPFIKPSVLHSQSWDCLPLLRMEVSVTRDPEHSKHHQILKDPNWMKITILGAYNMSVSFQNDISFVAATKTPVYNNEHLEIIAFDQPHDAPANFNHTSFYKKWESLKVLDTMPMSDEKLVCELKDFENPDNIDLDYYVNKDPNEVLFGSFHRTLIIKKKSEDWLYKRITRYKWPLELHVKSESVGYSYMSMIDLSGLLYPGVTKVRLAVPLEWIDPETMLKECNCETMFMPNNNTGTPSTFVTEHSRRNATYTDTISITEENIVIIGTGADDNNAFVLIEVELKKPFKEIILPAHVSQAEILEMLETMEGLKGNEHRCTGLGQNSKDWMATVRMAATALRRVPYYGTAELNSFNKQLSETRTRVEIITSFWQDAAVYVNNKFVVKHYLHCPEMFEELVMMGHVCLMKIAFETLVSEAKPDIDMTLISARQARQMQDKEHAKQLYLELAVRRPNDANTWRELSTCLKDINKDWACICLNKAVVFDPRHPLTLVSKGGMVFEEDPAAAEMFFVALLSFYPFWTTAWIVASAYYYDRQEYLMSDKILDLVQQSRREGETEELGYARAWERELGDWWDNTPILPGSNPYYDAADLLLRLRCITLAEVCVSRALTMSGETVPYFHLIALCCRLRGRYEDALCHIDIALKKFGELAYLRSLEADCHHNLNNTEACLESYAKAGCTGCPHTVLKALPSFKDSLRIGPVLADLVRCYPSAYAWMALADNWMSKSGIKDSHKGALNEEHDEAAVNAAIGCAEQALKRDRFSGPAWAFLANLVKPSARKFYCRKMATLCGYDINKECVETDAESLQSMCYQLGKPT